MNILCRMTLVSSQLNIARGNQHRWTYCNSLTLWTIIHECTSIWFIYRKLIRNRSTKQITCGVFVIVFGEGIIVFCRVGAPDLPVILEFISHSLLHSEKKIDWSHSNSRIVLESNAINQYVYPNNDIEMGVTIAIDREIAISLENFCTFESSVHCHDFWWSSSRYILL